MNNEIKYSCDNCLRNLGIGCKSPSICICGSNYLPADDPNITYFDEIMDQREDLKDEV